MPIKLLVFKFVGTVIVETLLIGLLLSVMGFLIAGRVGFVNMLILGQGLGLMVTLVLSFAKVIQAYGAATYGDTRFKLLGYGWFAKTNDASENTAGDKK